MNEKFQFNLPAVGALVVRVGFDVVVVNGRADFMTVLFVVVVVFFATVDVIPAFI